MGVAVVLVAAAAAGDSEAGGVTEGGFLSFFGGAPDGLGGDSPPDACVCGEYRSSTCVENETALGLDDKQC